MDNPLSDADWKNRCCARLLFRDPELSEYEAVQMAEELVFRAAWRALPPEAAADRTFEAGRWTEG